MFHDKCDRESCVLFSQSMVNKGFLWLVVVSLLLSFSTIPGLDIENRMNVGGEK